MGGEIATKYHTSQLALALLALREKIAMVPHLYQDGYHYLKVGYHATTRMAQEYCASQGGACLFAETARLLPGVASAATLIQSEVERVKSGR